MASAARENAGPLPLPRSLRDHRTIRRELVALYRQAKRGLIEPALVGRLTHILNSLAAIARDVDFEERLAALEAALAERDREKPQVCLASPRGIEPRFPP